MKPCFYCGIAMTVNTSGAAGSLKSTDETVDHVIPRRLLKRMSRITTEIHLLNRVPSCLDCNDYKGNLSPLDWLVIMPSNEGATRLGELLMKMGCTIDEVAKAMGRRA